MKKKIDLTDSKMWQSLDWDEKEIHPELKRTDRQVNVARANRLKANNPEFRKKMSDSHNGLLVGDKNPMYGKNHTEEIKQKLSENRKGEKHWFYNKKRPNHAEQMRGRPSGKAGKPSSDETKRKISEAVTGKNNPMYGKHHSEQTLEKLRMKLTCPHCGKEGGKSNIKRWHFDNCKHK